MKSDPDRSLKSLNMKWLVMLAVLDMIVVLLFVDGVPPRSTRSISSRASPPRAPRRH